MSISQKELQFNEWKSNPHFPNITDNGSRLKAEHFVRIIKENNFNPSLYKHQQLAILNIIYSFEIEKDSDVLLDIVTGGGKTVIMAGILAYFWQVYGIKKFLILTPNTIVRERVKDDFEISSSEYAYNKFAFFVNGDRKAPDQITTSVLRDRSNAQSVISANIVIANIHQLYEGKDALDILIKQKVPLVILNDEAHNAAADQYREVLKLLREQTFARVDLTATPFRLDGENLDTFNSLIYSYQIKEATRDRIVKQVIVAKPDIESVKMVYEEWDDQNNLIKTIEAKDMPWDEIESTLRKSGAVKFVTAEKPRKQQLKLAVDNLLKYQEKCVPLNEKGLPSYTPILMIVALSQMDAKEIEKTLLSTSFNFKRDEVLLVHSGQEEYINKIAFLMGRKNDTGLNSEDKELYKRAKQVKVVIGVSMLREGWDVRNISVLCLFRKFSYKKVGEQTYTVYGPQIVGRGLRKINIGNQIDHLLVLDHPAFNHDWLWEYLGSTIYTKSISSNEMIDENIISEMDKQSEESINANMNEEMEDGKDMSQILKDMLDVLPDFKESIEPVENWQKYFMGIDWENYKATNIETEQKISGLKTKNPTNENTSHEIPDITKVNGDINSFERKADMTREEIIERINLELESLSRDVLQYNGYFNYDNLIKIKFAINWVFENIEVIKVNDLLYIEKESDEKLSRINFLLPLIVEEFNKPEVILSIIQDKK